MTKKNITYSIFMVCFMAVLIAVGSFTYLTFQEIKNNSAKILDDKNKIRSLEVETTRLEDFKKNYDDYKPNLEKLDNLFVNAANPVDFIKFLETTANATGMTVKINFVSQQANGSNSYSAFQVASHGNYANTIKFFEKLEKGPYLVQIQNMSIQGLNQRLTENEATSDLVDANILLGAAIAK